MLDRNETKGPKPRLQSGRPHTPVKKHWTYYLDVCESQNWEGPISQGPITRQDDLWYDPDRFLVDKENALFVESGFSLQQGETEADILRSLGYRELDLDEDLSPPQIVKSEFDRGIYEDNT